jgi:ATP-binding cassette subfamily B protein
MNVVKQINSNECGICALASVYEHYYGIDIKTKLLEEANVKEAGLSLYDFEKLAINHGIFCETYKLDNKEFVELKPKEYFVALMRNGDSYHYVVVKKNKDAIHVYDSAQGKYKTNTEDFLKNFSGIIILISPTSIKPTDVKKQNIYD